LYEHVNLDDFRYPGPPPQTRETAIVMLADSVEAFARSEEDASISELEAVVDRVFDERLAEGELDHCQLTLSDLAQVRAVFKAGLHGLYHPRVRYPLPAGLTANPAASQGAGEREPQEHLR
jgi:hypothetical protein